MIRVGSATYLLVSFEEKKRDWIVRVIVSGMGISYYEKCKIFKIWSIEIERIPCKRNPSHLLKRERNWTSQYRVLFPQTKFVISFETSSKNSIYDLLVWGGFADPNQLVVDNFDMYYSFHESMVSGKRFHGFVVSRLRHLVKNPIDSAPDATRWVAQSK